MYVGRIVSIGRNRSGQLAAMYRVSSRSFPNRRAQIKDGTVSILPKEGCEGDIYKNPYIAYNCLKTVGPYAVATNGSHTDPVAEKLGIGVPVRDALCAVLLALDYEHDSLDTPRIAAVVEMKTAKGFLGIIRKDALLVREFALTPGQAFYVCTYEHNAPSLHYADNNFDAADAPSACRYILNQGVFADLERPITAACAVENSAGGFELAAIDAASNEL